MRGGVRSPGSPAGTPSPTCSAARRSRRRAGSRSSSSKAGRWSGRRCAARSGPGRGRHRSGRTRRGRRARGARPDRAHAAGAVLAADPRTRHLSRDPSGRQAGGHGGRAQRDGGAPGRRPGEAAAAGPDRDQRRPHGPEARGQGCAALLPGALVARVLDRHERPFPHVAEKNTGAIALYGRLGFTGRKHVAFRGFRIP
ncbi:GNAT family N-acetyltransferase [Streptomyces sp. NPDC020472]|uniref:GNAT family N-acetyltransferase n=1 Tax=Streptomyces sp. NPDC020472 TaxID=3365075 RepID=UPI0037B8727B